MLLQTVQQHLQEEQRRHYPQASGEFSWLLSGITLATKIIAANVRRAGITADVLGATDTENVQGEVQQKLDVLANHAMMKFLGNRGNVAIMASEEDETPVVVERDRIHGKYVVVFDPLDGSSNIDVNVSVGTIFSVLRREPDPTGQRDIATDVLQPGYKQVAAGYVVYGSSTMLVYTTGNGVFGFTLDPAIGAYLLSHERIVMPDAGKQYSCNEANFDSFPEGYKKYLGLLRSGETGRTYSSRYIGSLVADFHRTLLKGGVFLYPPTKSHASGKLRLLYEANPIAFLAEQAGGVATNGKQRILDIQPTEVHQRTPLCVGSKEEMNLLMKMVN
ncbi:Fructose-1,6-bisphosphatase class 1 [Anatilimnocola aggregata]|uniref:Fructose-1,6-bisphosphatase class 1 n=1 Tax=Anatilimnocola aggregata TaxID=2528021 RepID=A0A517Y7V6_9BACT|nr:class 1 fructose-bisphosphatase [Anatilimnocola aggregata]QDU26306.1 Fructose-1,6-bisphosphatase class 1 [Anatilimnocola aggregata]